MICIMCAINMKYDNHAKCGWAIASLMNKINVIVGIPSTWPYTAPSSTHQGRKCEQALTCAGKTCTESMHTSKSSGQVA